MTTRPDGRGPEDLRPLRFTRDYTEFAAGSVLVEMGRTKVICTASAEDRRSSPAAARTIRRRRATRQGGDGGSGSETGAEMELMSSIC